MKKRNLNMNYFKGSFLTENFDKKMKEEWNIDKFDVIVGNPPYNAPQNNEGKRGGGDTLWDKFVIKSLEKFLKENGYLVLVHPPQWRKPQSKNTKTKEVNELMMNKQINYLNMHNSSDGVKIFNSGTKFDYYLLQNCNIYKETKINDEDGNIFYVNLKKFNFIPNKNFNFLDKIKAINNNKTCPIIFDRSNYETRKDYVSNNKTEKFKYPLVHSTPKSGTRYKYSSRNDKGHFGISKVIFGETGIYDVIIDMEGDYGMTQHAMAIKVDNINEAEKIKKVLLSERFKVFLSSVMWSTYRIDWRLFTYLKKDFWKEFNI